MAYYNYYNQYPYNGAYQPNQSFTQNVEAMKWVDGEIGAKAFQMPPGWPAETPIVLWDNSEKKIYLKSWNQMGMPNPMQELTYEIKERTNPAMLPGNISGDSFNYVTKEDLEAFKEELRNMISTSNKGSGSR